MDSALRWGHSNNHGGAGRPPYRGTDEEAGGTGGEGSARASNGCRVMQRDGACEGRTQEGEVCPLKGIDRKSGEFGDSRMFGVGDWTDAEIATFTRRVETLKKRMTEMDAEQLAETMLMRDRPDSGDDRRICLECIGWKKPEGATAARCTRTRGVAAMTAQAIGPTILQRCDSFALRGA